MRRELKRVIYGVVVLIVIFLLFKLAFFFNQYGLERGEEKKRVQRITTEMVIFGYSSKDEVTDSKGYWQWYDDLGWTYFPDERDYSVVTLLDIGMYKQHGKFYTVRVMRCRGFNAAYPDTFTFSPADLVKVDTCDVKDVGKIWIDTDSTNPGQLVFTGETFPVGKRNPVRVRVVVTDPVLKRAFNEAINKEGPESRGFENRPKHQATIQVVTQRLKRERTEDGDIYFIPQGK